MNSDQDEISSWAFNYIGFVINQRLMSGMGDGTFAPQEPFTVEQAMVTCYRLCQQLQVPEVISKEQANLWLDIYHMNRKYEFLAGEYLVDINAGYVSVYYGGTADGVSTVSVEKMTVDGIGELERATDVYFPEAGYPIKANMAELHVVARSMHVDT